MDSHPIVTLQRISSSNKRGIRYMQSVWKKRTVKEKGHSRWRETKAKRYRERKTTGSTEAGTNETMIV